MRQSASIEEDKQKQREASIMDILRVRNFSKIAELSEQLGISQMTVRRTLLKLEERRMIRLVHGGVVLEPAGSVTEKMVSYSLVEEGVLQRDEKMRIGLKAASLIEPNDIIVIDSGTTTEYLAKFIPDDTSITILCYTLNVLFEVYKRKNCKIIFAGGSYHDNTMMFESAEALSQIKNLRATKAFMGATGVSSELGLTCSNSYEPEVKRAVINSSQTKIFLVDSSKFDRICPYYFSGIEEIDTLITDSGIPPAYEKKLTDMGKKLFIV